MFGFLLDDVRDSAPLFRALANSFAAASPCVIIAHLSRGDVRGAGKQGAS